MSQEIRRVPPNWEHPVDDNGQYKPIMGSSYKQHLEWWQEEKTHWDAGDHYYQRRAPDEAAQYSSYEEFQEPPDPEDTSYWPVFDEEPTWYQLYQTISEGTPLTPPFPTKQELADHMVRTGYGTREQVTAFVDAEWAPTFAAIDGEFYRSTEVPLAAQQYQPTTDPPGTQ